MSLTFSYGTSLAIGITKSRFFAMLEEPKKDCKAQKLTDKEKQGATNNQIKMAVQAMDPTSGTAR